MLTERQSAILKIIVEEYIKVPKPVGSKSICDSLNLVRQLEMKWLT